MADRCDAASQTASDLRAAATIWRKHLRGPASQPSPSASDALDAVNQGIEQAAKWVDERREHFMRKHGYEDPETGTWEYGKGQQAELKHEYEGELAEIAEGIRALKSAPAATEAGERE